MASGNGFFSSIIKAFSSGDFINRGRRTLFKRQDVAGINVREASRRGPQFSRQVPQQPQESEPTQDTTGVVYTSQTTPETVQSVEAGLRAGVGKEGQPSPPREYSQRIVKGSQVAQAQEAGVPFGEVPESEVETENTGWVTEGGEVVAPRESESPSVLSDASASLAPSAGPISRPIIVYSDSGASSRPGASEIRSAQSARGKRQALMVSLLARQPSQEEKALGEVVGGLKSIFWPFGRRSAEGQVSQPEQTLASVSLPTPGTPQYNLAVQTRNVLTGLERSVERFPELAGETELLERLSSAAPDLARSIIETTGQIRGVEFIPPERTDEQRFSFNPRQDRLFNLELPFDGARNFIRIAEQPLNKAVGSVLPGGIGKAVGSGLQNVTSKLAIASKGAASAALKIVGSAGLKAALAVAGPVGWVAAVAPLALDFIKSLKGLIIGTFGVMAVGILFITSMGAGSFSARGGSSIEPGGSEYIAIKTEVDPKASFENSELPTTVVYKIKIIPKQVVLGAVDVKVSIAVSNKDGSKTIEDKTFKAREVDSEFVLDVPVEVKPEYADSTLVASIRATARVHEQPERQSETASSVARIGNPPEDCPNGWATPFGRINSKPNDPDVWTHKNAEAIDIGNSNGVRIEGAPILSTHKGKVSYNCGDNAYGNCIKVTTTCNGRSVSTLYAHMRVRTVENDKDITAGVKLGEVGATGNVWGTDPNHLHYEFQKIGGQVTIPMQPPYVPRTPDVGVTW